ARHGPSRGFADSPTTTKGAYYVGSANLDHVGSSRIRGLSPIQECSSKPPTRTRSCENFFHAPAVRFLSSAPHHRSRAARLDRSALRPTNLVRPSSTPILRDTIITT